MTVLIVSGDDLDIALDGPSMPGAHLRYHVTVRYGDGSHQARRFVFESRQEAEAAAIRAAGAGFPTTFDTVLVAR